MEQSKTQLTLLQLKVWWFPAMVGVVVILGFLLVVLPQAQRLIELRDSIAAGKKVLTQLQQKVDQITQLEPGYIEELSGVVSLALPDHKPFYEMFSLLQQLAVEAGVTLGDFDLSPGSLASNSAQTKSVDKRGYVALDTTLTIQGTTDQVVFFIDKLQRSLPLVTVTSISMSGDINELDTRQATLDMTVNYTAKAKDAALTLEKPLSSLSDIDRQLLDTLLSYSAPSEQTASGAAFPDYNRQDVFSY